MGAGAKRRQSREGQGSHRTLAVLPRSTPPCKPTGPAPCLSASQPTLSRPYRHPRPRGSAPASRRHPSRRASGARAPIAAPSAPARRPPSLQHLRPGRYAFGARIPTFLRHRRPDRPSTSAPSRPSVPAHARLRACELPTPRPPSGTRAPTRRTSGIRIPTVAPRRPHPNLASALAPQSPPAALSAFAPRSRCAARTCEDQRRSILRSPAMRAKSSSWVTTTTVLPARASRRHHAAT